MDLLTVVVHELGHIAGLGDRRDSSSVMHRDLRSGVRRIPSAVDLDVVFAEWNDHGDDDTVY
jgi:hypothetical protein